MIHIINIINSRPEYAPALANLQTLVFPTLSSEEWFSAAMYRTHIETFPDEQFMALAEDESGAVVVVGATTTFRTNFDFASQQPPFYFEFIGGGYLMGVDFKRGAKRENSRKQIAISEGHNDDPPA